MWWRFICVTPTLSRCRKPASRGCMYRRRSCASEESSVDRLLTLCSQRMSACFLSSLAASKNSDVSRHPLFLRLRSELGGPEWSASKIGRLTSLSRVTRQVSSGRSPRYRGIRDHVGRRQSHACGRVFCQERYVPQRGGAWHVGRGADLYGCGCRKSNPDILMMQPAVCTGNLICVDGVIESPMLTQCSGC